MNITSAKYVAKIIPVDKPTPSEPNSAIIAVINGKTVGVPICPGNMDYEAILEWVADGNMIQDAD